jgi:putative membrane protein
MKPLAIALCVPFLSIPVALHAQQPSAPVPTQTQQPPPGVAPGASTGARTSNPGSGAQSANIDCMRWKVSSNAGRNASTGGAASTNTGNAASGAAGGNASAGNSTAGNSTASSSTTANAAGGAANISAQDFLTCAALGDMLEIESSKLAANTADSKSKSFASRMVKDHTATANELKQLATKANVTLPSTLDQAHQDKLDKLKQAKGAEFDKLYDQMQVEAHEAAVGMFEAFSRSGSEQDLKAFADKHLPALREHLKMARELK